MRRRSIVLAAGLLASILLGRDAMSTAKPGESEVTIDNFSFTPAQLTVAPGTKVNWTNRDDIPHTITDAAAPRAFKSPPLDTGDGFSYVFQNSGTYHYFCSLHAHMTGTIVVQ
jgi:plastocyanin